MSRKAIHLVFEAGQVGLTTPVRAACGRVTVEVSWLPDRVTCKPCKAADQRERARLRREREQKDRVRAVKASLRLQDMHRRCFGCALVRDYRRVPFPTTPPESAGQLIVRAGLSAQHALGDLDAKIAQLGMEDPFVHRVRRELGLAVIDECVRAPEVAA